VKATGKKKLLGTYCLQFYQRNFEVLVNNVLGFCVHTVHIE